MSDLVVEAAGFTTLLSNVNSFFSGEATAPREDADNLGLRRILRDLQTMCICAPKNLDAARLPPRRSFGPPSTCCRDVVGKEQKGDASRQIVLASNDVRPVAHAAQEPPRRQKIASHRRARTVRTKQENGRVVAAQITPSLKFNSLE